VLPADVMGWLQLVGAALTVGAGTFGVWMKIRQPVRAFMAGVVAIPELATMQDGIESTLRRIERDGRRRGAMMRSHIANNSEGMFETDADGNLEWCNDTLIRWTGLHLYSLTGKSWLSIIATDQQEEFREAFDLAIGERREFRGTCLLRCAASPHDSNGNRAKHLATDWRGAVTRDPEDPKVVFGYTFNVKLRSVTGPQPATTPATDTGD
jgi:PAS domain-containing protein